MSAAHHIHVNPATLERWRAAAATLGDHGIALRIQLGDLGRGSTSQKLRRCVKAARLAEQLASGKRQVLATAIAEEIEKIVEGGEFKTNSTRF